LFNYYKNDRIFLLKGGENEIMYKSTGDLKREAKSSLKGRWKEAVMLNLVPSILQILTMIFTAIVIVGIIAIIILFSSGDIDSAINSSADYSSLQNSTLWEAEYSDSSSSLATAFASIGVTPFLSPIIGFVMTFLTIGISFTFLDVVRKKQEQSMSFKDAFRLFNGVDFVPVLLINVLMYIFTYLWTLLFIIPGIVKGYSYSQSNFIYKDLSSTRDTRSMGATTFITESRELMKGHKRRLFWLDITFIGWYIIGMLTFGIAMLWINPYINATKAAFYNDLAKDRYLQVEEEPDEEMWTSF